MEGKLGRLAVMSEDLLYYDIYGLWEDRKKIT